MRIHHHDSGQWRVGERGRHLGQRWADRIGATVAAYRRHFETVGIAAEQVHRIADASLDALAAWSPPLAAEIGALADGAGLPRRELAMLNARTEILASAPNPDDGECSTVVRVPTPDAPDAEPVAFQTWDWNPRLAEDGLLWRYEAAPGRWVKTFTEFGMLAKIGINSAGLAVQFNILHHRSDATTDGVPVHAIARRILDEASTLEEARDLVRSAPIGASTAITVLATGSAGPAAASIEIAPADVGIVAPRADGWLLRTNHFLSRDLADGDRRPAMSTTADRLEHLTGAVSGAVGSDDLPSLARALCGPAGGAAPICVSDSLVAAVDQPTRTLLSVRQDPRYGTFEYWPGTPYEAARAATAQRF